jgi:DNA mismatch repair protein MutS2
MTKTLEMLEEQLAAAALEAERVAAERTQLKRELQTVQAREEQIRKRSKELEREGAAEFLRQLQEAEASVGQVVAQLQKAPSFQDVDAARVELAKLKKKAAKKAAEAEEGTAEGAAGGGGEPEEFVEGARVMLLDLGSEGVVVDKPNKRGEMQVKVGALSMRTKVERCRPLTDAELAVANKGKKGGDGLTVVARR